MPHIADKHAPDHEDPNGEVQVPRVPDHGGQPHAATDQEHAKREHHPWPHAVHQHPQPRRDEGRRDEAYRKGPSRDARSHPNSVTRGG